MTNERKMMPNNAIAEDLEYEVITKYDEIHTIRDVWEKLANESGSQAPFIGYEWFDVFISNFCKNKELCIVVMIKGGTVISIAPLIQVSIRKFGVKINKLELIGNAYSPIRNLLFSNRFQRSDIIKWLIKYLKGRCRDWDIIELNAIPEEDSCLNDYEKAFQSEKMPSEASLQFGDWYHDKIDMTGEEYIDKLPKKTKKDIAYCKRRLGKLGRLEFEIKKDPQNVENSIDDYYRVYSKSWQQQEDIGPNFHRDLAGKFVIREWLRLGSLKFDDKPIAAQYWVYCDGTAYILKTVYDQEYRKYSPGKILTSEMIKYAIDTDNANTIDYIQGDEGYKKAWTPMRRERKRLVAYNTNLKGRMLYFLKSKIGK